MRNCYTPHYSRTADACSCIVRCFALAALLSVPALAVGAAVLALCPATVGVLAALALPAAAMLAGSLVEGI